MATLLQEENTTSLEAIPSNTPATARPTVLVFDSGVGGLSVYQEVRQTAAGPPLYIRLR
jgi:glutamate racemase